MKPLHLILAFAAVAAAQKPHKGGKGKPAYIAHSPGGPESAPQAYQHAQAPQHPQVSNHGGFGGGQHGGGSFSSGVGKAAGKPVYPLLLSDTRTLNPDGTINFDYKADNGLHQGETVDSDGTRRGFYSYPGADGKLITVKYTAGKNGFVAEGPHLPTQPQSAPYNPKQEQDDIYSSGKQGSFGGLGGGHYSQGAPQSHGGAYRPGGASVGGGHHGGQASHYSHSSGLGGGQGGGNAFANFPDFSSHFPSSSSGHHGGAPSYSSGAGSGGGRYPGGGSSALSGHPGGSQSFASLSGLGAGQGGAANFGADFSSGLAGAAQHNGPLFTASNPYQPTLASANPANPVNAGFDLGNGGHFSINFTPGAGQEYNVNELNGQDFGHHGGAGGGHHGGSTATYHGGASSGHGGESQGRY